MKVCHSCHMLAEDEFITIMHHHNICEGCKGLYIGIEHYDEFRYKLKQILSKIMNWNPRGAINADIEEY